MMKRVRILTLYFTGHWETEPLTVEATHSKVEDGVLTVWIADELGYRRNMRNFPLVNLREWRWDDDYTV